MRTYRNALKMQTPPNALKIESPEPARLRRQVGIGDANVFIPECAVKVQGGASRTFAFGRAGNAREGSKNVESEMAGGGDERTKRR
ncbi:hypothetical protein SCLCIDRAFT_1207478 [Scleroderma citrinum Foug A]|uniref:Uncharacterized protein n=1 Tax=Scleroderma citrinum Foug A TaxID=1036808 RepID=A0A0C3A8Z3_9AGAM|nr:hypothetical protein SCLCIDRAFT_1207478 [Scleroderma citrinum Foug A]